MRVRQNKVYIPILVIGVIGLFWMMNQAKSSISVSGARAVATSDGMYRVSMTLENHGGPDVLTDVSSPVAKKASIMGQAIKRALAIPAGASPSLAADGAHIMLAIENQDLKAGEFIALTLSFENAGVVAVKALVSVVSKQFEMETSNANGAMDHSQQATGANPLVNVVKDQQAPSLFLKVEQHGVNEWSVLVETENFEFTEPVAPAVHEFGQGHGHLYLNSLKLQRLYGPEAVIGELPPGVHTISVTLNTNDHKSYAIDGQAIASQIEVTAK